MTPTEIKAYFTEFATTSDADIQRALDVALITCSELALGTSYDLGLKYLTAHLISFSTAQSSGKGSAKKSIDSKSVDGVSVSYKSTTLSHNDALANLDTTSYGQIYARISFGSGAGGFTC